MNTTDKYFLTSIMNARTVLYAMGWQMEIGKNRIFFNKPRLLLCFYFFCARLLFKGGFYSRAASIQGRLLFKGGLLFTYFADLMWLQFDGGFYSRKYGVVIYSVDEHNYFSNCEYEIIIGISKELGEIG